MAQFPTLQALSSPNPSISSGDVLSVPVIVEGASGAYMWNSVSPTIFGGGASGPSGPSGAPGVSGASGPSGAPGVSGASGPSGASGASGATGFIGQVGPTGMQGLPGGSGSVSGEATENLVMYTIPTSGGDAETVGSINYAKGTVVTSISSGGTANTRFFFEFKLTNAVPAGSALFIPLSQFSGLGAYIPSYETGSWSTVTSMTRTDVYVLSPAEGLMFYAGNPEGVRGVGLVYSSASGPDANPINYGIMPFTNISTTYYDPYYISTNVCNGSVSFSWSN